MQIFIYSFYFEFRVVFGLLLLGVVFNGALLIHDFENMSKLLRELRRGETHPVCLSCSAESATEAISLALFCTERVFHIALKAKKAIMSLKSADIFFIFS